MLHNTLINKDNLDQIFDSLAQEYIKLGETEKINIYLVGGAAIVLKFNFRLSTVDIDGLFKETEALKTAILNTSTKLNLPSDWLNTDFMNTPSYSNKIMEKAVAYKSFYDVIVVYSLDAKYLIAMKLKSSRPASSDLDDVIKMIYELRYKGIHISYEEIIEAYKELYPDFSNTYDYFLEKAKEAFKTPVEDFEFLFKKY